MWNRQEPNREDGLVLDYCITNYHKFSSLKQDKFITSQFLWVRIPSMGVVGPVIRPLQL